jgi:hypothetical protein
MSDEPYLARDTQFIGFAKLLFEELKPDLALLLAEIQINKGGGIEAAEEIIKQHLAQRAYDFMKYMMGIMPYLVNNANIPTLDAVMQYIPDMTEWPKEE